MSDSRSKERRQFMAAMGGVIAGAALPTASTRAAAMTRTPLTRQIGELAASYDIVVIGSGYGGAVMAARLAPGRKLAVLERGKEWAPADFTAGLTDTLAQFRTASKPLGLFDYRIGGTVDVLTGNGIGGTSLINANVVVAPDRDIFARWPQAIRAAYASGAMDVYEQRVRTMLAADSVSESDALRKSWFHVSTTKGRKREGAVVMARALPLAVNLRRYNGPNAQGVVQAPCTHCGDCVTGCRVGAKNSLDVNYLPAARAAGAEIFARIEVDWIERMADGRWRVHYLYRADGAAPVAGHVTAKGVIIAAGSLGSTQILLRSRSRGLALSPTLGTRFSTNGDLLSVGFNTRVQTNVMGFGIGQPPFGERRAGPTITTAADYRAATIPVEQRFMIEDAAVPSALVDAMRVAMPIAAGATLDFAANQRIGRDLVSRRADGALNHSMVYLGIGHDSAAGRIELDGAGNARVNWPGLMQEPWVARMRAEMARHAQAFGGKYADSPRTGAVFGGVMTTVHPLGGCPMGETAAEGVVNADGQVFNPNAGQQAVYPGLRVMDGAIAPTSLGANPLLTIAALAERAAERFQL